MRFPFVGGMTMDGAPDWGIRFTFTLLFPTGGKH